MHGKTSQIHHTGTNLFTQIENPFVATRYHSLVVDKGTLPDCLDVNAWTLSKDGKEIMGIQHISTGVQMR